jgi:hypothetical protein
MTRQVLAAYDDEGVVVYQAFKPSIVEAALAQGRFGRGFNRERMTWIKPSFGWMLYRSGYATKHHQERILKIRLRRDGFLAILDRAVPTSYDRALYPSEQAWKEALDRSEVRVQWDPDRDLTLQPLDRRAIQLGLSGRTVHQYVDEWLLGLEDVTSLARAIEKAVQEKRPLPPIPEERPLPLDADLRAHLGIPDGGTASETRGAGS